LETDFECCNPLEEQRLQKNFFFILLTIKEM